MRESDFDYFRRRAAEERRAADGAAPSAARQIHLDLARRYEEIAEATRPLAAAVPMAAEAGVEASRPTSRRS